MVIPAPLDGAGAPGVPVVSAAAVAGTIWVGAGISVGAATVGVSVAVGIIVGGGIVGIGDGLGEGIAAAVSVAASSAPSGDPGKSQPVKIAVALMISKMRESFFNMMIGFTS